DAADSETPRDGGEIRRSEADQLLAAARPIAGDAADSGQVLPEPGIVVDDDSDRDAAPPRRFQLREMVLEAAVASEAQHLSRSRRALGAERGRTRPSKRSRRPHT